MTHPYKISVLAGNQQGNSSLENALLKDLWQHDGYRKAKQTLQEYENHPTKKGELANLLLFLLEQQAQAFQNTPFTKVIHKIMVMGAGDIKTRFYSHFDKRLAEAFKIPDSKMLLVNILEILTARETLLTLALREDAELNAGLSATNTPLRREFHQAVLSGNVASSVAILVLFGNNQARQDALAAGNHWALRVASAEGHLAVVQALLGAYYRMAVHSDALKGAETEVEKFRDYLTAIISLSTIELDNDFIAGAIKAYQDQRAVGIYSLVVFASDDYLTLKTENAPTNRNSQNESSNNQTNAKRFFNIARSLPLELQMLLAYHTAKSSRCIIPAKKAQQAFVELSRKLANQVEAPPASMRPTIK